MKELSIEEKAKRYDEVIGRVVNIKTGKCETTFIFTEGLFDYLFPELEECNEEEVRKAMIDFFKHEREEGVVVFHYGVNIERMIAWLEKQGQVNETIISQHEDKICKENNDSLTSEDERIRKMLIKFFGNGAFYDSSTNGIPDKDIVAWLEKQGKIVAYYEDRLDECACKYPISVPKPPKRYAKYSDTDLTIAVKEGAKWQREKEEPINEDLGLYINELSKQFPEVSFAKLSRIAVRVAKWQKSHLWKPADGDDLKDET